MKKRILILYDYFDPAYKAGGPIRSLVNLVNLIADNYKIFILTSNQDLDGMLLSVKSDTLTQYGSSATIKYLSGGNRNYKNIINSIEEIDPDVIYLNGIFSLSFVVYPLLYVKRKNNTLLVIAPRGMLQRSSLSVKPFKKMFYLFGLKYLLPDKFKWHVTTEQEYNELLEAMGNRGQIETIGNIPEFNQKLFLNRKKRNSRLVLGTVALISPMKNIHIILTALKDVKVRVEYRIFGPVKDRKYWQICQSTIRTLPENINVKYQGEVKPSEVRDIIRDFDFYIQPSKSENFGHSIFEAFNNGIPVIISDQTPWKGLYEKKAGWDVDLNEPDALVNAIREAVNMDNETYLEFRKGARKIAEGYMRENDFVSQYRELFGG